MGWHEIRCLADQHVEFAQREPQAIMSQQCAGVVEATARE